MANYKYLDLTGLSHYNGKIQGWVNEQLTALDVADIKAIRTNAANAVAAWTHFLNGSFSDKPTPKLVDLATTAAVTTAISEALKSYYTKTEVDGIKSNLETAYKAYAESEADAAEAAAKAYADGLAGNYDAAGSAAQALVDAKSYADGLAGNYDAAGSAAAAETAAKAYADSLASNYDEAGSAAQALVDAKDYTDELNTAMNGRVEALEAIDHDHANKAELDLIASGDKAKWDKATTAINNFLTGTGTEKVVDTLQDIQDWMNGDGVVATELTEAIAGEVKLRENADKAINDKIGTVTSGKTVVGMIGDAETAAKTYADRLASNYDKAGSAAAAETAAKSYADGEIAKLDTAYKAADTVLSNRIKAIEDLNLSADYATKKYVDDAKGAVLGTDKDSKDVVTVYGVKAYAKYYTDALGATLRTEFSHEKISDSEIDALFAKTV